MRYWWVNQNQTFKHEVRGGFLWSPKTKSSTDGKALRNPFYDTMREVSPGDLVFSFSDTFIKAVGVATGSAQSADKPEFGAAGRVWDNEGWLVPVEFRLVENPIKPKDYMAELAPHLSRKYAPLQPNGNGNQGVYLAEVTEPFAEVLLSKLGKSQSDFQIELDTQNDVEADQVQEGLQGRTDIGATQIEQLVKARRGQGIFKANVRLNEQACRVTGMTDPRLLIASHIKPWAKCDDREKLDGNNGLLLSPHIDRLFDSGLISFSDDGAILISKAVTTELLAHWHVDVEHNVGKFSTAQAFYLDYHRNKQFKR